MKRLVYVFINISVCLSVYCLVDQGHLKARGDGGDSNADATEAS